MWCVQYSVLAPFTSSCVLYADRLSLMLDSDMKRSAVLLRAANAKLALSTNVKPANAVTPANGRAIGSVKYVKPHLSG